MKSAWITVLTATSLFLNPSGRAEDLGQLKADLNAVQSEIKIAQTEDAQYTGGLVKSLIVARIGVLRQTEAMLQQKFISQNTGSPVKYTIDGKPFNLPLTARQLLVDVEAEIIVNRGKLQQQEAKLAQYTGGLAQAMALATLETMRQTEAMLEQKRVSLRYGLPQYIGFADASKGTPFVPPAIKTFIPPAGMSPAKNTPEKPWSITEVDSRVTESNDVWWKYAWKLTLRNDSNETHVFGGKIEFQDSDGFIIDTSDARDLIVPSKEERVFTGYSLIRTEVASNVAKTYAKIALQR